jgi:HK97 family phage major capsid protein
MKIKVRLRASGAEVEIEESAFDTALHERITPRSIGDMPAEEFMTQLATVGARQTGEVVGQILTQLGVGQVNRGSLATTPGTQPRQSADAGAVEAQRIERVRPSWERQYLTLPESERKVRTVEGDLLVLRWAQAVVDKDYARAERIIRESDPVYSRAPLAEGAAATGGNLVPTPLASVILMKRDAHERIAPRSMRFTSPADTLDVPTEATVGDVAATAEATAPSETDSTFGLVTLTKKKVMRACRASRELLADISQAFSLVTILSDQVSRRLAVFSDGQAAVNGNGTPPNWTSAIQGASITAVTGSGGAITRKKIKDLLLGLPSEWRNGPGVFFFGNAAVTGFLSDVVDTTGRPIWLNQTDPARPVGDVGNAVGLVEGIPYLEVAPFSTNILYVGVLAEGYGILEDEALLVEASTEASDVFLKHQVLWKFMQRRDGAVLRTDCFRKTDAAVLAPA